MPMFNIAEKRAAINGGFWNGINSRSRRIPRPVEASKQLNVKIDRASSVSGTF